MLKKYNEWVDKCSELIMTFFCVYSWGRVSTSFVEIVIQCFGFGNSDSSQFKHRNVRIEVEK